MVRHATAGVLVVLAAASGWLAGSAAPGRPSFVALVAVLVVLEAAVVRIALSSGDPDAGRGWMWIEAFGLLVGVKVVHVVTVGASVASAEVAAGRLLEPETVTGWIVGGVVWGLTHATLHDVDLLGYPGDGPGDPGPVARIRARFFRVGFVLVVTGSVGAVGLGGLVDVGRPAVSGPLVPLLVYFTVGLVALGRVDLRHEERQWRRDGARIDADVASRWTGMSVLVVGVVLVAGLAIPPRASAVGGVTSALTRVAAGLGRSAIDWFGGFGDRAGDGHAGDGAGSGPIRTVPPAVSHRGDLGADLVRDVAMLLVLAVGLGLAFIRWERRREGRVRGSAGSLFGALWRLIREGVVAFVHWLVRLIRGVRALVGPVDVDVEDRRVGASEGLGWVPPDGVRRRIAAEYRTFLVEAEPMVGPRHPAETSGEYGRRVARDLPDPRPVRRLTGIFDLARYSGRALDPSVAEQAVAAHAEVRDLFGGEEGELR